MPFNNEMLDNGDFHKTSPTLRVDNIDIISRRRQNELPIYDNTRISNIPVPEIKANKRMHTQFQLIILSLPSQSDNQNVIPESVDE